MRGTRIVLDRQTIERARIEAGLLVGEVAQKCNLHRNTVTRALGGGTVGLRSARRIALGLRLRLRDIIVSHAMSDTAD